MRRGAIMGPVALARTKGSFQAWRGLCSCVDGAPSSSSAAFKKVGFIGLGNMGSHMANNLMKAGYELVVYDKNEDIIGLYSSRGVTSAKTPSEVAQASDAVITMLPSASEVCEVYLGCNGLLSKQNSCRSSLLIDASTIDPQTCRKIASFAKECSLSKKSVSIRQCNHPVLLDAPVSGGVLGAQAGTLTFMVGGLKDAYDAARSLLGCMGKRTVFCGGSGNGAAAKICNNLALAISMAGISEALALGQQLGIDARTLSSIFNSSSARCWSSDTYNPVPGVLEGVPASKNYDGGFSCQLMRKDLGLAIAAAEEAQALTPLTRQVHGMYSKICNEGKGSKDFSGVFSYAYMGKAEKPM